MRFLPTTKKELNDLGWQYLDVILVSGDTYIDSPYIGVAVIGRVLTKAGYRVGIIAQPDIANEKDIKRLGEPRLFWGVTSGSVDSMVTNYTATKKRRKSDDFTPGGLNTKRPDRAVIAYSNLIRQYFKNTCPIVIGGIEASLRRIAHYDFWTNKIRKSILFDAKADVLIYGMGEKAVTALAYALKHKEDYSKIKGTCYISQNIPDGYTELPPWEEVKDNKKTFTSMFDVFYRNNDPLSAVGLAQKQDNRYLVQNPPAPYLSTRELDQVHNLPFTRDAHPYYAVQGKIKALETIRFAITTHRGCYGECNFCAIAVHQGRTIRMRSEKSILLEAVTLTKHPKFKGIILDVGGPTANMYGFECQKKLDKGSCAKKRCLFPAVCNQLHIDHSRQLQLLKKIRKIPKVKKVFIASGIRYDMIDNDRFGDKYLQEISTHHVSGQLKIAPEHCSYNILQKMGKPGVDSLLNFKQKFDKFSASAGKKQFLTYYFIAAHPGCREKDMQDLRDFCSKNLQTRPEQAQIFTPTPSTYSTLMYWTEKDLNSGEKIFVEKDIRRKEQQKAAITSKSGKKNQSIRTNKKKQQRRYP